MRYPDYPVSIRILLPAIFFGVFSAGCATLIYLWGFQSWPKDAFEFLFRAWISLIPLFFVGFACMFAVFFGRWKRHTH